MCGNVKGKWN